MSTATTKVSGPKRKRRRRSATAGRKAKGWLTRARLDLLPLEPAVAKLLVQRTPELAIAAWIRSQPQYEATTDDQALGLCAAIKARWAVVRDDPGTVAAERAAHAAMIDAAIHDAWNRPVIVMTDNGPQPARNPDGTLAVRADHKALAAYLKERREFYGFGAAQKHVHVHGTMEAPPPAALTPADREAEIRVLLERRAAALGHGRVIDVPAGPESMLPAPAKKNAP